ncbi:unnamed protein product, partial [Ceratitis capitata]
LFGERDSAARVYSLFPVAVRAKKVPPDGLRFVLRTFRLVSKILLITRYFVDMAIAAGD